MCSNKIITEKEILLYKYKILTVGWSLSETSSKPWSSEWCLCCLVCFADAAETAACWGTEPGAELDPVAGAGPGGKLGANHKQQDNHLYLRPSLPHSFWNWKHKKHSYENNNQIF